MIEVLDGARRRLSFLFSGYVLMPDHWHVLIGTRDPLTISQVIHDIKKVAARRLHQRRGTEGPHWQHQFWDRFMRLGKEFWQRLDYVSFNPVRKGLVAKPQKWRWSSYNNFPLAKDRSAARPIQIDCVRLSVSYSEC